MENSASTAFYFSIAFAVSFPKSPKGLGVNQEIEGKQIIISSFYLRQKLI